MPLPEHSCGRSGTPRPLPRRLAPVDTRKQGELRHGQHRLGQAAEMTAALPVRIGRRVAGDSFRKAVAHGMSVVRGNSG